MWQDILVYVIVAAAVLSTVLHFRRTFRKGGGHSPCDSCPGGCGCGKTCGGCGTPRSRDKGKAV